MGGSWPKEKFSVVGGSTPKSDVNTYWDGEITWVTPADLSSLNGFDIASSSRQITDTGLSSCGASLVPEGSIILSTRAPIGSLGIAADTLCTNQGCKTLVPSAALSSRFYAYLLTSVTGELNARGKGTTFLELSGDALAAFTVPLPSNEEQTAIAAFLDRETGKIDALVAEQETLIALLKEKRQAVISHAVTKGLNPSAPMKNSGIEWLGEVPAHWEVKRLKNVVPVIEQGWSPEAIDRLAEGDEWGVLKSGCVNHGVFRDTEHKTLPLGVVPPNGLEVSIGNLLMSRASGSIELIGSAALVERCSYRLIMSDKIFRLDVNHAECTNTFLVRVLGSSALRTQIVQAISGAEGLANNIGKGAIREFWLALPPLPEQSAIVAYLDQQTATFDALTAEAERAITLLKEHRSALISAAVTGKIDVRGLVPVSEDAA